MTNKFSVAIPAYNEAKNLEFLLPKIKNQLIGNDYEVLIIDIKNPTDKTKDIVKKNGFKYLTREHDNSYGSAVRTAIKNASGRYIIFMDADGSHEPKLLSKFIKESKKDYDIISASRYVKGGKTENPFILNLMSRILNLTFRLFLNIKMFDISNSYKLYKKNDLNKLELLSNNFDIIQEMVIGICINKKDVKTMEIPFNFKKRKYGNTKRSLILFMITYLFTIIKLIYLKNKKKFFV